MAALSGPIDQPSPKTSSVTPCRTSLSARGSSMIDSVAQDSELMKPGATTRPVASSSVRPRAPPRSPTATMRSAATATSARRAGAPVPSITWPPRSTSGYGGSPPPSFARAWRQTAAITRPHNIRRLRASHFMAASCAADARRCAPRQPRGAMGGRSELRSLLSEARLNEDSIFQPDASRA